MKQILRPLGYCTLVACLLLLGYGWHDYFYGLRVVQARLIQIADDPQQADGKVLVLAVESSFSEWPWVPDGLRRFFHLQPQFCPLNPDGTSLVNEDAPAACFPEQKSATQPNKSHVSGLNQFHIPFYTKASRFSGERLFVRSLTQQNGLWFKLKLQGALLAPPVESKPVFLDFRQWCAHVPERCRASFGQ